VIVFGIPLYGGNCTAEFADSMGRLQSSLDLSNVPYRVVHHVNDSLIPRARNCLVARFMGEFKDFTHFMFIDADIQFEPEDVAKLWNLDVDVACGCYPTKKDNAETTAWKDGKLVKLEEFDGPTEIDYAGTGFLMIKREVFEKLQDAHPETRHMEGHLGEVYALFDTQVIDAENWQDRWYCSEDYLFCKRWRDLGGKIILDPSIKLGHVGRKVYR
jgi:hypothetical protein